MPGVVEFGKDVVDFHCFSKIFMASALWPVVWIYGYVALWFPADGDKSIVCPRKPNYVSRGDRIGKIPEFRVVFSVSLIEPG